MSHFTCLVIGDNYEEQLAPYHEFECTGNNDEYVIDVDRTEEARQEYLSNKEKICRNEETGAIVSAYDDRFYKNSEKKDKLFSNDKVRYVKVRYVPEGWVEEMRATKDMKTFREFLQDWYGSRELLPGEVHGENHKFGFVEIDESGEVVRLIKHTNPNAQWDWYSLGGRWCGFFPLKDTSCGVVGCGTGAATGLKPKEGTADHIRKGDVDIDRARREAEEEANSSFDKWEKCFTGLPRPSSWKTFFDKVDSKEISYEEARKLYGDQPVIKRWDGYTRKEQMWCSTPVALFGFDREAYVKKCRNNALVTFAVVKDGKWHDRGSMGWWRIVSDEKDQDQWSEEFQKMYDELPDDTMLTLVDCHI